jgi:endonuclease/exonuclease/phosphatase family metal-dependent hydrolase
MSFNIRRIGTEINKLDTWNYRKYKLTDLINKESPDILCLQEDNLEQQKFIQKQTGMLFVGHYSGSKNDGQINEYNSIFFSTKLKLLSYKYLFLGDNLKKKSKFIGQSKYYRTISIARFQNTLTQNIICVYNTHLDHLSEDVRIKSIKLINTNVNKREKYVLCGDFNISSKDKAYTVLTKYFQDKHAGLKNKKTILDWAGIFGKRYKMDFILSNIQCKNSVIITDQYVAKNKSKRYFSDHIPINTNLMI